MAKELLAEQGITLEIVEFSDYVQPNMVTESGEVDANYFQHQPYLDSFNEENGTHLVSVGDIHYEPLGIYPGKSQSLEEIPDGAVITVPNDTTNEARALQLLAAQGIITIREDGSTPPTAAPSWQWSICIIAGATTCRSITAMVIRLYTPICPALQSSWVIPSRRVRSLVMWATPAIPTATIAIWK